MATKLDKSKLRYSDYYCYMSLADFTAYISCDDSPEETSIKISATKRSAS